MKRWSIVSFAALGLAALAAAESLTLTVHTDKVTNTVGAGIIGQFLEQVFHSLRRGLWGRQKAMPELPGRTCDVPGPGCQQEHRRTGPGARGIGTHGPACGGFSSTTRSASRDWRVLTGCVPATGQGEFVLYPYIHRQLDLTDGKPDQQGKIG